MRRQIQNCPACITVALLLAFFGISCPTSAQQESVRFRTIGLEQGLSQSAVMSLVQDHKGFLWVGTQDGLNRFDGVTFKVYRNNPRDPTTLSNNYIKVLYEDRSGTLWAGTDGGGLCRYDRQTDGFKTYQHDPARPASLGTNFIWAIREDQAGSLWVGTLGGGLCRFDRQTETFTVFKNIPENPNSLSSDLVFSIYQDQANRLWIGTWGGGICRFDPGKERFTRYANSPLQPEILSSNFVYAITEGQAGELWIATGGGGVTRFDPRTGHSTVYKHNPNQPRSLSSDFVFTLLTDRSGTLWVATRGGGLCRYQSKTDDFDVFAHDPRQLDSLSSSVVRALCEDQAGTLWIGTESTGLCFYDRISQRFSTLRHNPQNPEGLPDNAVKAMCEDTDGTLWIGTWGGGLCHYDPGTDRFTVYKNDPKGPGSLPNNSIFTVLIDRQGTLWVGTDGGGLCRFDRKTGSFKIYQHDPRNPTSLTSNDISALGEDRDGTLWVGLNGQGFCRFDAQTDGFTRFQNDPHNPNSLSSNVVYVVLEDHLGLLWLATRGGGLCCFNRKTGSFKTYLPDPNNPQSISHNVVISLHEDRGGTLWVGTRGGGLNFFNRDQGVFQAFHQSDGLPNEVINAMQEDRQGNLWLSTNQGLSKFNPMTRQFRNFDANDGLQSQEFSPMAALSAKNGRLYFAGIAGFTSFFPDRMTDNSFVPPMVITGFKIFNQYAKPDIAITEAQEITVDYKQNFITFEFAALSFTQAEKNQYTYKLEGFDTDWIPAGTQRSATYTNLDGGTYTFHVKGANNDGVWNTAGASIRVKVIPPPWKRWWAFVLYALGFGLSIFGGVSFQIHRVTSQAHIREARLKAEAAEIQARAVEAENRRRAETEAEIRLKNAELDQKVRKLHQMNEELVASQKRADRIFSALAEALPGTVLEGKYRLEEKIGIGGFGVVFRATHLILDRPIAVKIFRPSPGNDSASSVERFKLEGVSASRINHRNAITVLDSGISPEGFLYLVMELLQGQSLSEELKAKKWLSLRRSAEIIGQVCSSLAEAHRLGIIHRDIKPGNIFLHHSSEGEIVKVVDFGIAKLVEENTSEEFQNLTGTGNIIGTPRYMSPERLTNKAYDGKSDVYSVGIMIYEMLCGTTPFESGTTSFLQVVMAHVHEPPPPLRQFQPGIPPEVEAVVLRALDKDPEKRPTARELGEEFNRATTPYLGLEPPPVTGEQQPGIDELPTGVHSGAPGTKPVSPADTSERIDDLPTTEFTPRTGDFPPHF